MINWARMDIFRETQVFAHLGITAFYFVRVLFLLFFLVSKFKRVLLWSNTERLQLMSRLWLEISCNMLGSTVGLGCVLSTGIWHQSPFSLVSVEYQLLKICVVRKAIFFLVPPCKNKFFLTELWWFYCCKCSLQSYESYFKISSIQLFKGVVFDSEIQPRLKFIKSRRCGKLLIRMTAPYNVKGQYCMYTLLKKLN